MVEILCTVAIAIDGGRYSALLLLQIVSIYTTLYTTHMPYLAAFVNCTHEHHVIHTKKEIRNHNIPHVIAIVTIPIWDQGLGKSCIGKFH